AVGSIKLIVSYIIDAWIEGRKEGIKMQEENAKKLVKEQEKVKLEAEKAAVKESKAKVIRSASSGQKSKVQVKSKKS
ncbi:MAG: hypothetical protein U1E54_02180, partial [Candidatus Levybacteria bacterium]|nr:hypothetical protein [Candidatus Levybacteria bacterium]